MHEHESRVGNAVLNIVFVSQPTRPRCACFRELHNITRKRRAYPFSSPPPFNILQCCLLRLPAPPPRSAPLSRPPAAPPPRPCIPVARRVCFVPTVSGAPGVGGGLTTSAAVAADPARIVLSPPPLLAPRPSPPLATGLGDAEGGGEPSAESRAAAVVEPGTGDASAEAAISDGGPETGGAPGAGRSARLSVMN